MSSSPEQINLQEPDASRTTGFYGRDFLTSKKVGRIELLPDLLGPAVEVFYLDEPLEVKRYEGNMTDLVTMIEDEEFSLKAVELSQSEIESKAV